MGIKEVQVVSEIANIIYDFLPANPHPYADQKISFPGCANKVGVGNFWRGGSKRPAVSLLLKETLENAKGKFCPLMIEIVKTAIIYKQNKGHPIKREEIEALNKKIVQVGFKIPELWDEGFLNSLPKLNVVEKKKQIDDEESLKKLKSEYIALTTVEAHKRGYAFQAFLNELFQIYNLTPRSPFRIVGEEIDGSFDLSSVTYLLEAKWQAKPTAEHDLLVFSGKIGGKSTWARGLFISYGGFTNEGLEAFARGKQTNIIGIDGQDLFFILDGKLSLIEAINRKARRAAETNDFFVSVYKLVD